MQLDRSYSWQLTFGLQLSSKLKTFYFTISLYVLLIFDFDGLIVCRKQLLDPEEVDVVHQVDKEMGFTLEDCKLIKMHMANCMYPPNLFYDTCVVVLLIVHA